MNKYEPTEWKIEYFEPNEIVPYEYNAKTHDRKQIKNIANSIRRFGWKQPVVITKDHVIVIGHGRRLAAIELGCKVPCVVIDKNAENLTDDDIKELRLADNLTNESPWDFQMRELDIKGLDFDGFDFDLQTIETITGEGEEGYEHNEDYENDSYMPDPYDDEMVKEYEQNAEDYVMKRRIIITYLPEEEPRLARLLGFESDNIEKVVYDLAELIK